MSFILRPVRKIVWFLPFYGRRQALALIKLLFCTFIGVVLVLYTWPDETLNKTNIREFGCTGRHGCTERGGEFKEPAPPLPRLTATVRINATTKTPLLEEKEKRLEPKNWNGQGYTPVSSDMKPLRHCKQCALVTSSGHLSGKGMGQTIDNSECIIRMNAAPTLNYTKDVGSRTTFRVIGHRNFPRMFDTEAERRLYFVNTTTKSEAIVVLWLYSVNVNRNLELILSKKFAQKYKDISFYLTNQEVMNRNVELFYQELGTSKTKGRLWMSTGWVAMLFALEVCNSIDVYGMIYDDYCKEHPNDQTYYHYFDKVQTECKYYEKSERRLTSGHKFMTEKVAFGRWASKYDIRFHTPSWENHQYNPNVQKETVFQKVYMQYKERLNNRSNEVKVNRNSMVGKAKDNQRTNTNEEENNVPQDNKGFRTGGENGAAGEGVAIPDDKGANKDCGVKADKKEGVMAEEDCDREEAERELDADLIEDLVP
ncbi:alpha-N-acetylgalactosaminide alpha-2,6-sialyltransferase 5-like [Lytechinus pictus]|uniref:alpha-N-acetylgalactosaminide alpha-2,6-sialyltransferase 5-like n=1 Tax=Lytechinus pictus TaxID=7653 RepID=UPI0030B9C947